LENSLSEEKFESYLSTYKNSINTLISIADYDFAKADQDLAKNAKQLKEIEEKITLEEKDKEKEGHEERIAKLKEEKTQLEEAKNKIEETQKQIKEAKSTLEKDKTKNLNDFKEDIKNAKGGSPISGNFKFEEMLDFALEKAANSNQTEGLKERCNILQAKKGMLEKISHNTNQINGSSSFFGNTWNAVKRLNEGQPLTLNKKEKVELQLQTLALACDTLHPNRPDDEIIADIAKFAQEYPGQGFEKLTSRDDWQTKEGAHIFNTYKALKLKDEMEESKKKEPDTNSKNTTTLELNPDLNPDISTPNPEQNSKQNPEPVSSTTWASKLSQESQPEVNQR
jgi:chromosome segregation ATPase